MCSLDKLCSRVALKAQLASLNIIFYLYILNEQCVCVAVKCDVITQADCYTTVINNARLKKKHAIFT